MLKLETPVQLTDRVQLARLPNDCHLINEGTSIIVAGTGPVTLNTGIEQKFELRQEVTETISWKKCNTTMDRNMRGREMIQTDFICATVIDGQSTHYGDSGGPVLDEQSGTLIGVVNFHNNDETVVFDPHGSINLQVSANIRAHFEWIKGITGLDLPKCGDFFKARYSDWLAKSH